LNFEEILVKQKCSEIQFVLNKHFVLKYSSGNLSEEFHTLEENYMDFEKALVKQKLVETHFEFDYYLVEVSYFEELI
jgi:hypothetical protein